MSSDDIIVKMENISKRFEMYSKPADRLKQMLLGRFGHQYFKEFWALRDISFEVHRGECVGIVGKNGAGKSTLLQILVGTLMPTSGNVFAKGRVAALLELGSGFNPEFTGHDNVYMNASILGLTKDEIDSRYQAILDFADIGEFINQPVKTYSSGMMVRLAFAVLVMTDPDILVVDEALAVGDTIFQRKCYIRIQEMIQKGMTLLFVSHDTEMVKRICSRVLFLNDHRICYDGPSEEGIVKYLKVLFPEAEHVSLENDVHHDGDSPSSSGDYVLCRNNLDQHALSWGTRGGVINEIKVYGLENPNILRAPKKIKIAVSAKWDIAHVQNIIDANAISPNVIVGIRLSDVKNTVIYGTNNCLQGDMRIPVSLGRITAVYELELPELIGGDIFITAALSIGDMKAHIHLVWDDLAIVLKSVSTHESDGLCYFKTSLTLQK